MNDESRNIQQELAKLSHELGLPAPTKEYDGLTATGQTALDALRQKPYLDRDELLQLLILEAVNAGVPSKHIEDVVLSGYVAMRAVEGDRDGVNKKLGIVPSSTS